MKELLVPVEKFSMRMPMMGLKLATLDYKPSALAIEPYSSKAIAGKKLSIIKLVYCLIIILSFLNCDWLLIREVQWLYWKKELLVPVEKFQWGCQWWDSNSQPLDYKLSALAIELYTARKLLLGRSWVYPLDVLHNYNFIIYQLWLTSHPRSTVALLDIGTPGTSREIFCEDADDGT